MLCLDNSDYMRNSDYAPTRMIAQKDAVNLLCSRHIDSGNPESTIGLLTMAGSVVDVRAAPSRNRGLLYTAVDNIALKGASQIVKALKIAQLALKHGIETKGVKRIVLFVGSPIQDNEKALKKAGKNMRRNNVSIDAIMMGDFPENEQKLRTLVNSARKEDGPPCELVTIPPGVRPVEVIRRTHLCGGRSTSAAAPGPATTSTTSNSFEEYGGFDPNLDPEMAQAMKMSMMEERARMEQALKESAEEAGVAPAPAETAPAEAIASTEDEMLQEAIRISMMESSDPVEEPAGTTSKDADENTSDPSPPAKKSRSEEVTAPAPAVDASPFDVDTLNDPATLEMLLQGVGVEADDPLVAAVLEQIKKQEDDSQKDGDKDK